MKYKKLVIILSSVIGAVLLLVVLTFTLFRVNSVSLNFKNQTTLFASEEYQNEIIATSKAKDTSTIFAVNKSSIKNNLEREYSYLKVINIETVFPNSLIIHCAQREETYIIKINDNLYYVCDEEFKVLSIATSFEQGSGKPVLLEQIDVNNKTAKVGEFLDIEDGNILKNIITAFAYNNRTIADFKGAFKSVRYQIERDYYTKAQEVALIFTIYDNFEIKIGLARCNLIEKTSLMLAIIPKSYEKYNTHRLIIELNPENVSDTYVRYEALN